MLYRVIVFELPIKPNSKNGMSLNTNSESGCSVDNSVHSLTSLWWLARQKSYVNDQLFVV